MDVLSPIPIAEAIEEKPQPAIIRPFNIFVADDDCDDTDILSSVLKEQYPTTKLFCYNNALEAYRFLDALTEAELPDLIILDYSLPHLSGSDILKRLKDSPRFNHIPKIIYSSLLRDADTAKCLAAGATVCLKKTFYLEKLRAQVKEMISYCDPDCC